MSAQSLATQPAQSEERRSSVRRPCRLGVSCRARLIGEGLGRPWPAALRDASRGGIRLQALRPISTDAELVVALPNRPGLGADRRLLARVVQARRVATHGGYFLGCALSREELSDTELAALAV